MIKNEAVHSALLQMPKVELHVHLEGAIRKKTYIELASRNGEKPDSAHLHRLSSRERYSGLSAFVSIMRAIGDACLRSAADYGQITYEFLSDQARRNIIYTEFSFDPTRGHRLGIDTEAMMAAVDEARQRAEEDFGISAGIIIGLGREHGVPLVTEYARKAVALKRYGIVGLDLHGNEAAAECQEFAEAYDLAREAGLGLRAHVGESTGPESVRQAVETLGVSRVAHGVSAAEDGAVVALLRERGIMLDMCPTSNYMLNIVKDLAHHPIRALYEQGVPVSVSTDDPLFFDSDLIREYEILMDTLQFTLDDLVGLNLNAAAASFAGPKVKEAVRAAILTYQNQKWSL